MPNVNLIFRAKGDGPHQVMETFVKDAFAFVATKYKRDRARNNSFVNRKDVELPDGTTTTVELERAKAFDIGHKLLIDKLVEWGKEGANAAQWQRQLIKDLAGEPPDGQMLDVYGQKMELCTASELVPDHDHETKKYRRMMHWKTNITLRTYQEVNLLAHNASKFDHIFLNEARLRCPEMLEEMGYTIPCRHHPEFTRGCKSCKKVKVVLDASMGDRGVSYLAYYAEQRPRCIRVDGVRCNKQCEKDKAYCNAHSDHHDRKNMGGPHDGVLVETIVGKPIHVLAFGDSMKHVPGSLDRLNDGAIPTAVKAWRRARPGTALPPHLHLSLRKTCPTVSQAWADDELFEIAVTKNLCPHGMDEQHTKGRCPYGLKEWWGRDEFPPAGAFDMEPNDKKYIEGLRVWDTLARHYAKAGLVLRGWDYYEV
jgi:hypothetical protein